MNQLRHVTTTQFPLRSNANHGRQGRSSCGSEDPMSEPPSRARSRGGVTRRLRLLDSTKDGARFGRSIYTPPSGTGSRMRSGPSLLQHEMTGSLVRHTGSPPGRITRGPRCGMNFPFSRRTIAAYGIVPGILTPKAMAPVRTPRVAVED